MEHLWKQMWKRTLLLILLGLLCLCHTFAGTNANRIELHPPSVVVKHGSSVAVNCSTETENEGMGWEASQGGAYAHVNTKFLMWKVDQLTNWDLTAQCYVNLHNDEQPVVELSLIIYKPLDEVSLDIVNHKMPLIEGSQYNLSCNIKEVAPVRYLTVRWYKNQTLVENVTFSDSTKSPVNMSSILTISPTREDDGAQYLCEAVLELGPDGPQTPLTMRSNLLHTIVHYGPDVSNCPEDVWLKEGGSLEGFCSVIGNPPVDTRWQKEQQDVNLSIPIKRNDMGNYTIFIEQSQTALKRSKIMRVFVTFGPEISCPNTITAEEGKELKINCIAEGYPKPAMTWLKEGKRVDFPEIMNRTTEGTYVLIANNSVNMVNHSLHIEVLYPPSDISALSESTVEQGSNLVLKCVSSANPRPQYKWTYHMARNVWTEDVNGESLLHIDHASGHNIGTYTCNVHNKLGEKSYSVRVEVKGAEALCPISIDPPHLFLEDEKSQMVVCSSTVKNSDLTWSITAQTVKNTMLVVNSSMIMGRDSMPSCSGHFVGLGSCSKTLNVTFYKLPDDLTISVFNHTGPMLEHKEYELQCDIQNVVPGERLIVNWYKGLNLVNNSTFFYFSNTPANWSSTLRISPSRVDDGVPYSCESVLDPGPGKPHTLSMKTIDPFYLTVHYKPIINNTKLPPVVPVFRGYPETLFCDAKGHPRPTITWSFDNDIIVEGNNLTVTDAKSGTYNCTATNSIGSSFTLVRVVVKEDYLPLIAGFVAVVVVVISIVFVCIYSIYYKNTKMGRYTVEGAKPSTQNGNVAQNGKDNTLPMKKLSQAGICV